MTRLVLVRHASHGAGADVLAGRAPGIVLSALGEVQAERLARRLASVELVAVHTSPRERTQQTAAAVADRHGLAPVTDPALDEVDYGEWTGRSFAQLAGDPRWNEWNRGRSAARVPGGETIAEVRRRVHAGVDALTRRHPDATAAVVTHSEIIRLLLLDWLGCSADAFFRLDISPASISVVDIDHGGSAVIRSVNDTAHLSLRSLVS